MDNSIGITEYTNALIWKEIKSVCVKTIGDKAFLKIEKYVVPNEPIPTSLKSEKKYRLNDFSFEEKD